MGKVVVVTDSTAYLPPELILRHGIRVIPLSLIWENKTYHDGIDISPDEFYARLKTSKTMPSSSQTTPAEFKKLFSEIAQNGNDILGIFLSSGLSGTVESALKAKAELPDARIEVVDSKLAVMAVGFLVLEAARAVQGGADLHEAASLVRRMMGGCGVMFVVDTLEFLHRGGRIGGARRFVGTALSLKPILELQDGKVEAIETVRTKSKATERMVDLVAERIGERRPLRISPLHALAMDEVQALKAKVEERFHPEECFISEVSPVIGTHVGPGTVGLAYSAGR